MVNPPREQDRATDLLDTFNKYGYGTFPQQRAIYEIIGCSDEVAYSRVVEVGCGHGFGTAFIHEMGNKLHKVEIIGTDKLARNVNFAAAIYPWVSFALWDVEKPFPDDEFRWQGLSTTVDEIVCVEVLEHLSDPVAALRNMLDKARCGVWLSTPNGRNKPRPPDNPYHVREYTISEVLQMVEQVNSRAEVIVYNWETGKPLSPDSDADPVLYRIDK